MANGFLEAFPDVLQAGVTTKVERSYSDYDDTWTYTFMLRGATILNKTGTYVSGSVQFTIAATDTLVAGDNNYQVQASKSGEVIILELGTIRTLPDFSSQTVVQDQRSHVKKCLDLIEAKMEGRLTSGEESFSIDGVSISMVPVAELSRLHGKYKMLYQAELNADRVARGLPNRNKIYTRFA